MVRRSGSVSSLNISFGSIEISSEKGRRDSRYSSSGIPSTVSSPTNSRPLPVRRAVPPSMRPGLQMQALDGGAGNDRVARLRVIVVGGVDEDAGAVLLDEQDAAGGDELARRDVDRSGRAVLLRASGDRSGLRRFRPDASGDGGAAGRRPLLRRAYWPAGCASFPGSGPLPLPRVAPRLRHRPGGVCDDAAYAECDLSGVIRTQSNPNELSPASPGNRRGRGGESTLNACGMPYANRRARCGRSMGEVVSEKQAT